MTWAIAAALVVTPAYVTISTGELRASYDTLWAVSDVHGRLDALEHLLRSARLVTDAGEPRWTSSRQLFVVVGDSVDGPDSAGVLRLLQALQAQAPSHGSRVVVLLGNHEVEVLARPRKRDKEVLPYLRSMPAAAFVGSWLFAHAGYVESPDYFSRLAASWSGEQYRLLREPTSIVGYHDWWASRRRRASVKSTLAAVGVDGLVFGHDPDAFGAFGTIAVNEEGWLTKLDSGLKGGRSRGMLLRCDVARIVSGDALAMQRNGRPTCAALTPDGAFRDLPVR